MILNEFFNLPQVFEKDMTENSPTDRKTWMASIEQQYPDVRFVQAKMPGAPIMAMVNSKPVAQWDGKPSVAEDTEQTPFGSVTTTNAPVKPTQYHYGTEPSDKEIKKTRLQDIRQRKQDLLRDFAQLGTLRTEMIYGLNNDVFLNKEQLLDYFDHLVDDPNLTALEYAHENGIPVSGLLKAIMSRATQLGISALDVRKLFNSAKAKAKQDVPEGIFGSRPSPVLPVVDKIAKVASGLTPQNVEVGKQIIQNKASEITRMLSPQTKPGIDVIEQDVTEKKGDLRPKLGTAHDMGKSVRKWRKNRGLDEQGVAEGKDDYVPPKEADYGEKYQAMVRRVGQKAKQQEKAKQQPPKTPVRESRLALLRQIIQS